MSFSNQFRNPKNPSGNFRNNNDGNNRRPRWLGFGLLAALTIFVLANVFTQPGQQLQQVPYSQFLEQVEAGEVKEAVIAPDQIRYQLKGAETGDAEAPQGFRTVPVQNDQQLAAKLRANDVEFSAIPPQNDGGGSLFFWLIAPILLYLVVGFFIRRGQGVLAGQRR